MNNESRNGLQQNKHVHCTPRVQSAHSPSLNRKNGNYNCKQTEKENKRTERTGSYCCCCCRRWTKIIDKIFTGPRKTNVYRSNKRPGHSVQLPVISLSSSPSAELNSNKTERYSVLRAVDMASGGNFYSFSHTLCLAFHIFVSLTIRGQTRVRSIHHFAICSSKWKNRILLVLFHIRTYFARVRVISSSINLSYVPHTHTYGNDLIVCARAFFCMQFGQF